MKRVVLGLSVGVAAVIAACSSDNGTPTGFGSSSSTGSPTGT